MDVSKFFVWKNTDSWLVKSPYKKSFFKKISKKNKAHINNYWFRFARDGSPTGVEEFCTLFLINFLTKIFLGQNFDQFFGQIFDQNIFRSRFWSSFLVKFLINFLVKLLTNFWSTFWPKILWSNFRSFFSPFFWSAWAKSCPFFDQVFVKILINFLHFLIRLGQFLSSFWSQILNNFV